MDTRQSNTINIAEEFNLKPEIIHVNHAAVAPWPVRTQKAVCEFAMENSVQGSKDYAAWLETESALREQLRQLINAASTSEIALLKSTSEALSVVAHGLEWNKGDSIVISAEEFPSNRIVWQSLAPLGVDVRVVEYGNNEDAEQSLIDACDETTRLVSVSAVQFASGRRMDLNRLGQFCRHNNILFCVDAIQALGAIEFDVQAIDADFVAADGHKWMLGAEGLALFYCRLALQEKLRLNQFGWHMVEHAHDFSITEWQPAADARRFECGSPNLLGTHALHASLSLLLETGMDQVEAMLLDKTGYLIEQLQQIKNIEIISQTDAPKRAGIVVFKHGKRDSDDLYNEMVAENIICAPRGGGIRLSPHFYTEQLKLEQLVSIIERLVA